MRYILSECIPQGSSWYDTKLFPVKKLPVIDS